MRQRERERAKRKCSSSTGRKEERRAEGKISLAAHETGKRRHRLSGAVRRRDRRSAGKITGGRAAAPLLLARGAADGRGRRRSGGLKRPLSFSRSSVRRAEGGGTGERDGGRLQCTWATEAAAHARPPARAAAGLQGQRRAESEREKERARERERESLCLFRCGALPLSHVRRTGALPRPCAAPRGAAYRGRGWPGGPARGALPWLRCGGRRKTEAPRQAGGRPRH